VLRDIGLPKISLVEKKHYDPEDLKKRIKIAMAETQGHGSSPGKHGQTNPSRPGSPPN
jgi:hypothetical protein